MTASSAGAQTLLSLEEALRLAESVNPRVSIARAQLDGARAGVGTARQYPNPDFEALGGGTRGRGSGAGGSATSGANLAFGFAQPIELPSVRSGRISAALAGQDAGAAGLAESRLDLRAAVKQAYADVLLRKAEVSLALETEALLEQIRYRIEVRVRVGEAARLELTRAEAELARAQIASASARQRVVQARAQLGNAIGTPHADDYDVIEPREIAPPAPSFAAIQTEIESGHPAMMQARAAERRATHRLETERALRLPQPTLIGRVDHLPESHQFLLGVSVPLPLFNQREGQINEARAALEEARATVNLRRIALLGAVDVALQRAEIARAQMRGYESGLIRQAENALAIADAAYRLGERGFVEVLDAQRVLRQVRSEALAARFELQAALIELERLRATALPVAATRTDNETGR